MRWVKNLLSEDAHLMDITLVVARFESTIMHFVERKRESFGTEVCALLSWARQWALDSSTVGVVELRACRTFSFNVVRWVSLGCTSARNPITDVGVDWNLFTSSQMW